MKVFAANGSPDRHKGNTAMVLAPFMEGMEESGATTELVYSSDLDITPCTGEMHCWYKHPGVCIHRDVMQTLYPKIKRSDVLILAMPVYIPIPGRMQIFINRLCPLILPELVRQGERTRARFHDDVAIKKIVLVSSGGWWEKGNFETVAMIAKELALNAGVAFAGALIRPHAFLMRSGGVLTEKGQAIIDLIKEAGRVFAEKGVIAPEMLDAISAPLVTHEEMITMYNEWIARVMKAQ
jgi:multimeric flavodoxin WrbA